MISECTVVHCTFNHFAMLICLNVRLWRGVVCSAAAGEMHLRSRLAGVKSPHWVLVVIGVTTGLPCVRYRDVLMCFFIIF